MREKSTTLGSEGDKFGAESQLQNLSITVRTATLGDQGTTFRVHAGFVQYALTLLPLSDAVDMQSPPVWFRLID